MRRGSVLLASLLAVACSFDWERYAPQATSGGAEPAGGAGGTGGALIGGGGSAMTSGGGGSGEGGEGGMGGQEIGPWSDPVPVASFADPNDDDDPTLTDDGLEVYFNSTRSGDGEFYRATRASLADPWGSPVQVAELGSFAIETNGTVSPDGLTFWFESTRNDLGYFQTFVATRADRASPWGIPVLATDLNDNMGESLGDVGGVTADGLLLFGSTRATSSNDEIYQRTRSSPSTPWSPPTLVSELLSPVHDAEPWLHPLGTVVVFESRRNTPASDLFISTRARVTDTWSTPIEIPELNSSLDESDATLTPDLRYIMFARDVAGEGREIYESKR
jgi:hypothetical protein